MKTVVVNHQVDKDLNAFPVEAVTILAVYIGKRETTAYRKGRI